MGACDTIDSTSSSTQHDLKGGRSVQGILWDWEYQKHEDGLHVLSVSGYVAVKTIDKT